jgi:protein SCO1/2
MNRTVAVAVSALASACWGDNAWILEGTVVGEPADGAVMVQHEEIVGYMPAMTMPFAIRDADVLATLRPGDRILARLHVEPEGSYLAKVRVVGTDHEFLAAQTAAAANPAVQPGEPFPVVQVPLHDGSNWTIGDPGEPTVLTFVYTRCPIPEFCPATIAKLQAVQHELAGFGRILAITLDPEYDSAAVLSEYAATAGATPGEWMFGRVEQDALARLAEATSLPIVRTNGEIAHAVRVAVLDAEGRLVVRYDDNDWDAAALAARVRGP